MSAARRSGTGFEVLPHRPEVGRVAGLVPGRRDGFGDQRRLDVVDPAPAPCHAPDHAGQHGEAFLAVVAVVVGGLDQHTLAAHHRTAHPGLARARDESRHLGLDHRARLRPGAGHGAEAHIDLLRREVAVRRTGHGAAVDIDLQGGAVLGGGPGRSRDAQQHRTRIALRGNPGGSVDAREHHGLGMGARGQPGRDRPCDRVRDQFGPVPGIARRRLRCALQLEGLDHARAHRGGRLLPDATRRRRRLAPEPGVARRRVALRGARPGRLKPPLKVVDRRLVGVDGPQRVGRVGRQLRPEPPVLGAQPARLLLHPPQRILDPVEPGLRAPRPDHLGSVRPHDE